MKLNHVLRNALIHLAIRLPDKLLEDDMRGMRRMAELYGKSDVVIDLGAHIGKSVIEFSHCVGKVYAFEPNPVNFEELKQRTRRYRNVSIYQKAVSSENGTTRLYFEDPKPGRFYEGSTIVGGKANVSYAKHFDVETASIADVLGDIDSNNIVIKMDIEGAEYVVLDAIFESGHLDKIKKIYVECHVDRIPELAEPKRLVMEKAERLNILEKLDFTWP
ncbi:FkbM family methyltransferase [Loktanella sp. Alg231-35]|uniref:FkbM family methyltransferase n=1 Tax=Loktanella sp. Alg231-35 TaxID=1922220 RepID=UPI00131EE93C|nr:FkbM family methyltransferase [Loktanella sp. Alg231-35]